jgi:hypothetical protein
MGQKELRALLRGACINQTAFARRAGLVESTLRNHAQHGFTPDSFACVQETLKAIAAEIGAFVERWPAEGAVKRGAAR